MSKQFFFLTIILGLYLFTQTACNNNMDDPFVDNPCFNISCQNDGTCVDGLCECTEFYTGESCEKLVVPSSITGSIVELNHIPNRCTTWDGGNLPEADADVYIQIFENNALIYNTRDLVYENSDCSFHNAPCYFNRSLTLSPTTAYRLMVWDKDNNNDDDLIGSTNFIPWNHMVNGDTYHFQDKAIQLLLEKNYTCSQGTFSSSIGFDLILREVAFAF